MINIYVDHKYNVPFDYYFKFFLLYTLVVNYKLIFIMHSNNVEWHPF